MPQQITITGVTGVGPYSIKVCDITYTTCVTITGSTNIPPTLTFDLPFPFETSTAILLLIEDSEGCTKFEYYSCTTSTTTTPPPTPTPIPLECKCVGAIALTISGGTLDFIDCFGNLNTLVPIGNVMPINFCASSVYNLVNVNIVIGSPCVSNLCI